jgi:flagellar M-ring protein FliF
MAEATLDPNSNALMANPLGAGAPSPAGNLPSAGLGGQMSAPLGGNPGNGLTETPAVTGPLAILENPAVKQALPAIFGLVSLAVCVLFYLWVSAPTYRSVYPGMSESDRQTAREALSAAGFTSRIDQNNGALEVEEKRYHEARILLASQDIPRSASLGGMESLLEQGSMTTSRFMEQVSYRAAKEAELAKSISCPTLAVLFRSHKFAL